MQLIVVSLPSVFVFFVSLVCFWWALLWSAHLGERNWRENEWRGEFDQSDSILFVCQRRENFSSSNSIIVYISHEFYIEFPAAHRYPWCNAQSKFALSRSPSRFCYVWPSCWNFFVCFDSEDCIGHLFAISRYICYKFKRCDNCTCESIKKLKDLNFLGMMKLNWLHYVTYLIANQTSLEELFYLMKIAQTEKIELLLAKKN